MKEKRELPRHVDSRIKLFSVMPIKNFAITVPTILGLGGLVLCKPSPFFLFIGGVGASMTIVFNCEYHGETGLDIVKSMVEYEKNGDLTFDRSTDLAPVERKFLNRK